MNDQSSFLPRSSGMSIRTASYNDFPFIRQLAADEQSFTCPSDYVLWFLVRNNPDLCLIAENANGEKRAYLLAMYDGLPLNSVFIWQIACATPRFRSAASDALIAQLAARCAARAISAVHFTTPHDATLFRWQKRAADLHFRSQLAQVNDLPPCLAVNESHYVALLDADPDYRALWGIA